MITCRNTIILVDQHLSQFAVVWQDRPHPICSVLQGTSFYWFDYEILRLRDQDIGFEMGVTGEQGMFTPPKDTCSTSDMSQGPGFALSLTSQINKNENNK